MSFTSSLTKKENSINSVHILISMLQSLIGIHVFNSSFFMSNESKYISAASFCKWHHYLMNFSKKVITFFIKDFDIWFICTYFFFKWSIVIYFILKALHVLSCKNLYPILLYALYNNYFSNRHLHPFTQGQLVLSKVLLILSS